MADITLTHPRRPARLLRTTLRACGALGVLGALAVGPPVALAQLGNPLPTRLVLEDVRRSLTGTDIADATVIKGLTCACWLVWAYLMVCVAVESLAWARGQAARALPLAGLVQPALRQLVISGAFLIGSLRPAAAAPATQPAAVVLPIDADAGEPAAAPRATARAPEWQTCTVKHRDSLWKLAEQHLGDGLRWREIYELNRGIRQPDGKTLQKPDLIRPGWTLRLPIEAPTVEQAASAPPVAEAPPLAPVQEAVEAPQLVPPADAAAPRPDVPSSPTEVVPPAAEAGDPAHPVGVLGGGLIAAGLVLTLEGLRRHRRAASATTPDLPVLRPASRDAQAAEAVLRSTADRASLNLLDLALRNLANQLRLAGPDAVEATRIEAVRLDHEAETIEILLTEPVDVDAGPFRVEGGRVWTLGPDADLDALAETAHRLTGPAPGLVTIGRMGDDPVLVDLELGGLIVVGDRQAAAAYIWGLALELATSPCADWVNVVVLGVPPAGLASLERLRVVATADDAKKAAVSGSSKPEGARSRWGARVANVGDGWPPTIVLVAPGNEAPELPPDVPVVHWSSGPAVGRSVELEADEVRLLPSGLTLQRVDMPEHLVGIAELLEQPADGLTEIDDVVVEDVPLRPRPARHPVPDGLLSPDLATWQDDPHRILVRILGPVRIEGLAQPLRSPQLKELLVYLALHPEGVTAEQIMSAIWPQADPSQTAFNNAISKLRTHLGTDDDGLPLLPYKQRDRYWPGRHVTSDLALHESARTPSDFEGNLTTPFAGARGFEWAYEEGFAHRAARFVESET